MVLRAKNIVHSVGTFIPELLLFSNNIQKLYKISYGHLTGLYNPYNVMEINFDHYYQLQKPWRNDNEDKMDRLINYKPRRIKKDKFIFYDNTLTISEWNGRLGNHIIQILQSIQCGLSKKMNKIILPSIVYYPTMINTKEIILNMIL